ncbi:MAG: NAD(P)-dependent glycerol-3-phosphate dehydrogenase [Ruminococcus sp.]|nr:NAD(P)-dependent glycerol-3-phosphate dehydrogenase [Ruminococcus sp.]
MARVTILGSGAFGLALAVISDANGNDVTVWSAFEAEIDEIRKTGENAAKLPGVKISKSIDLSTDFSCVKDADIVLLGIPSSFLRGVCEQAAPFMNKNAIIVNTSKGLEADTFKTMSQVAKECFPDNIVAVLTGPSHAEEVGRGIPTTVITACEDYSAAKLIQKTFSSSAFRVYLCDDVMGAEIGGSLKNVIALAAGVCDGLGLGDNTKAALMTRGINEIRRLGLAMGAQAETFAGLSGIGDLIVTCCSMHSRNRRAGIMIGKGVSPEEAVKQVGTVEGYVCTKNAYALSKKLGVEMPITTVLYGVLFEGKSAKDALSLLMNRPSTTETEADFLNFSYGGI